MNWEAIGAIGEILGALGVVITLAYLATQIQQNTLTSKVESKLTAANMNSEFLDLLILHPELQQLWIKGRRGEKMETEEYIRFSNMALKSFTFFSAGHFQYRLNALEPGEWAEIYSIILYNLRGPGIQHWWNSTGRFFFSPLIVDFIDDEIAKINNGETHFDYDPRENPYGNAPDAV